MAKFGPINLNPAYTVNDGNGGNNYAVTTVAKNTGVIQKASLTITAITNTKTYDAQTSAATTPTLSGLVGADTVTGLAEAYASTSAAVGKTLSISAYKVNDGNSGRNYTVTTVPNTTGVITQASLTMTGLSVNKVYDGTTNAALNGSNTVFSGFFAGDNVTVTGGTGTFASENVGTQHCSRDSNRHQPSAATQLN